ncbi:MAG: acyltransferase [Pseudomonadaceae bacterium]|nr:acyltransferase [Pseudomonadaceae bacterium]
MNIKNRDIETLRACAILLVLASHLRYFTSDFLLKPLPQLPLWQGVDLFFVISGFLISNSLQPTASKYHQGLAWTADLKAFWIRRIFRLLPAAWLWVFIPLTMALILPGHPLIGTLDTIARDALAALTNTANFYWAYCIGTIHWGEFCSRAGILGVYWSLSQEEQFYLVLPLALLLITKRKLAILLALTILALLFVERPVFSLGWYVRPDGLLWGVLLSLSLSRVRKFKLSGCRLTMRAKRFIFIALIIALILAPPILTTFTARLSTIGAISIISAALVAMCITGEALTPKGLTGSILAWLGSRSYALYLSHWPIYCIIRILFIPTNTTGQSLPLEALIFTLTWLVSCVALAEVTYRFIETPLKTYGYKLVMNKTS